MELLPKEETALKASRSSGSKRKPSLPQKLPASFEGESVVDCYDQTILESFENSEDPAMVNDVETPFVITRTGACDNPMQRTEAGSHRRNDVPMKRGKAHVTLKDNSFSDAGDSSREKGGTQ